MLEPDAACEGARPLHKGPDTGMGCRSQGEIFSFPRPSFLLVRLARRSLASTPGSASNKMPVEMIQGDGRWVKPSECEDRHPDPGLDWPHQSKPAGCSSCPGCGAGAWASCPGTAGQSPLGLDHMDGWGGRCQGVEGPCRAKLAPGPPEPREPRTLKTSMPATDSPPRAPCSWHGFPSGGTSSPPTSRWQLQCPSLLSPALSAKLRVSEERRRKVFLTQLPASRDQTDPLSYVNPPRGSPFRIRLGRQGCFQPHETPLISQAPCGGEVYAPLTLPHHHCVQGMERGEWRGQWVHTMLATETEGG